MRAAIAIAFLVLFTTTAEAAPSSMSFAGRLSSSSGPVNGSVTVTFSIFPSPMVGTAAWTDTIALTADQGLVFATLGRTGNPLDETVFSGAEMFLEIVVQGETLTPRLPINSTPYAIRSNAANAADKLGTLAPGDVVTRVTAGNGLQGGGAGGQVSLSINTAVTQSRVTGTCNAGSSIQTIAANGMVTCEIDDNTTYSALGNGGVTINGSNQVALTTCTAGQVLKAGVGGAWACGSDVDTTYTALTNGGIAINGTNQVALITCTTGQVLKAGAGGTWACGTDANTGTLTGITTGAGSGLTGGCTAGTCSMSIKAADFAATPATTYASGFVEIDTATVETITQVTINAPAAGTVLAIATADLFCVSCTSDTEAATVSLFITNTATGTAANNSVLRVNGAPTGGVGEIISASNHRVFAVAAGANTFFLRGQLLTAGTPTMRVLRPHISAFFSPQ
jgi:hypothetical protein